MRYFLNVYITGTSCNVGGKIYDFSMLWDTYQMICILTDNFRSHEPITYTNRVMWYEEYIYPMFALSMLVLLQTHLLITRRLRYKLKLTHFPNDLDMIQIPFCSKLLTKVGHIWVILRYFSSMKNCALSSHIYSGIYSLNSW